MLYMKLTKVYRNILAEQNAAAMGWKVGKTTLQDALQDLNVYIDFVGDPLSAQDSELQSNASWIKYETAYKNKVMQLHNASKKYLNQVINDPQILDQLASTIYDGSEAYEPTVINTPQGRRVLDKMYQSQLKAWQSAIDLMIR